MRPAFRPFFWFLLPWLIIFLVPQLRSMARVQALGSEYSTGDAMTLLAIWIYPLPPTAQELSKQFAPGQTPSEVFLKAPQESGQRAVPTANARRDLDAALQKQNAPLWMLALRLHLALAEIPSQRSFPAEERFNWGNFPREYYGNGLPLAGRGGWNLYEEDTYAVTPLSVAPTPPPSPKPLKLSQKKFALPLRLARRGLAAEPDNAFWRLQIAYLLTLAQRDDEATRELLATAKCSRYDSHLRDEMRAALGVARLHRALLWDEKLAVAARQNTGIGFPRCEQALLWLAERAEKAGDLSITAALARVAARMQSGALGSDEARRALLLQSAAWAGADRPAQVNSGGRKVSMWPQQLTTFDNSYTGDNITPLDFARPFANVARRKGRADLAGEALTQGRNAARLPDYYGRERFGIAPAPLALAAICDFNAQMALIQLQLVGVAWLMLSFLLWRRMNWAWRVTAQGWQILGLIWRVRDKPLDDETPVEIAHTPRDLRGSVWFSGVLILLGAAGMTWWSDALSRWNRTFSEAHVNHDWQLPAYFSFVAGPLLGGFLWCGSAALWRYARLKAPLVPREDAETYALHVPPSIIPRAVLLMCWSVTAGAALSWLLWFITRKFGATALNFSLPPLWAKWLDTPNLDFSMGDVGLPIFCTFVALGVWLVKWCWQLHLRRRVPALFFGLRWLRATLGAWLILGSWLYLVLLLIALPYHRAANEQIEKALPAAELSPHETSRS